MSKKSIPASLWLPYVSSEECSFYIVHNNLRYKLIGIGFDELFVTYANNPKLILKVKEKDCKLLSLEDCHGEKGLLKVHPRNL